jgi:hypothetical protein
MAKFAEYVKVDSNKPVWINLDQVIRVEEDPIDSKRSKIYFVNGEELNVVGEAAKIVAHLPK